MAKFLVFYLVTSLLVCSLSSAREFVRSFKLLSENSDLEDAQKGSIQNIIKIGPIPVISEVPTAESKRFLSIIDNDSSAFNPCLGPHVLCRNNGKCISRNNEYYCDCPATHYGKTCEFIADLKECDGNQCKNNATCYSIKEPKVVPNPEVLSRINQENQGLESFKNVTMSIKYECWCQHGFEGTFCEFSEGMRQCSEDKCNHHGIVVPFYNGADSSEQEGIHCKCNCEEGYFGEECEFISPCRYLECTNNGTCQLNSDGMAYCKCPESIELFPSAVISGKRCEIISEGKSFTEEVDPCFPCEEGQNFTSFLNCLEERVSISRSKLKTFWWADCEADNPNCLADLGSNFCFNGTCEPVISKLPSNNLSFDEKLFVLPKCKCSEGYEGNFCERQVKKECYLDCVHGSCCDSSVNVECRKNSMGPFEGMVCNCNEGYKGDRCEFKDPCYYDPALIKNKPCGEALCVELPGDRDSEELPHTCICKTSQEIKVNEMSQECADVYYDVCKHANGSLSCLNDGNCYPCAMDLVKNLQLCNDVERERGFRCICPPGLKQPFCQERLTACDAHRCLNGGKCVEMSNSLIDYTCDCPIGYSGSFCHISLGVCLQSGEATCVNGACVENINTRRGYHCQCRNGYDGFNCEFLKKSTFWQDNSAWMWPLIAFLVIMLCYIAVSVCQEYQYRVDLVKDGSPVVP